MLPSRIYSLVVFLLITPVSTLCKENDSRAMAFFPVVMPHPLMLVLPMSRFILVVDASLYRWKINLSVSDAKASFQKHYRFII